MRDSGGSRGTCCPGVGTAAVHPSGAPRLHFDTPTLKSESVRGKKFYFHRKKLRQSAASIAWNHLCDPKETKLPVFRPPSPPAAPQDDLTTRLDDHIRIYRLSNLIMVRNLDQTASFAGHRPESLLLSRTQQHRIRLSVCPFAKVLACSVLLLICDMR